MTILNKGQDLYIRKGDTGNIIFTGLPTDKVYIAYMSVYDEEKGKILTVPELSAQVDQSTGAVNIWAGEAFSDKLPVGEWVYGLKIKSETNDVISEDTLLPRSYIDESGNLVNEPAPAFVVDEKIVEGHTSDTSNN